MKHFIAFGLTLFCLTVLSSARAQTIPTDSSRFEYRKWQTEHRKTVQKSIGLDEYQKRPFWTVYDSYCRAIEYLELEYFQILSLYENHSGDMNDKEKKMLSNLLLKNDSFLAQVRRQYFKKFQRALSAEKAGEFMQLDNSMRAVYRLKLQKNNPDIERAVATVYSLNVE